jgi:hypothetical protein
MTRILTLYLAADFEIGKPGPERSRHRGGGGVRGEGEAGGGGGISGRTLAEGSALSLREASA